MKAPPQITPPLYEAADIAAIQALQVGEATAYQQKRALDWIIRQAAVTYDLSFSPESDRLTALAEGRRYVGLQIVKLLALNPTSFKKDAPNG
jgi:hypothetical protein